MTLSKSCFLSYDELFANEWYTEDNNWDERFKGPAKFDKYVLWFIVGSHFVLWWLSHKKTSRLQLLQLGVVKT